MYLTTEEEKIYNGEYGKTLAQCMQILAALGEIYDADRLIQIKSVQVAGVSYKTIGDAGLEWISGLDGRVVVPSILNPAGMDLENWREMGIDQAFAEKQLEIILAYKRLDVRCECTCTPYHIYEEFAGFKEHLAWSESSAVSYANSVIGARTNREGGPSALAAALIGKTANYGLHLDENRVPTLTVKVEGRLHGADFGAVGNIAGPMVKDQVPLFKFKTIPTPEELKQLGAALAASGSVALYHVSNVTPEAKTYPDPVETISIDKKSIDSVYARRCKPDLIALGCPHLGTKELFELANLLKGRKVKKELWIFTSRRLGERHPAQIAAITNSCAKVFYDTCMVVSPASERFECIMVNSGKALHYVPSMCGVPAVLGTTEECIKTALQ
ncbi:MAG: hypothetical protein LAKADJCE_00848 [Candidatus Argoarchaeum ethanivorans]|uniref:Phosphomevalonate dehydratase large subunit n=1 Tax=Candidatus Argoarchaeum ethanivorans TaxID=2608793 RepID=A0A811TIE5_9EURY|nr:MAG: hypothetical protein LAKADJCE_00848 [Candidatus Argoarchaeum ethanivorans]